MAPAEQRGRWFVLHREALNFSVKEDRMDLLDSSASPTTPTPAPTPAAPPKRRRVPKSLLAGLIILLGSILAIAAGMLKYGGIPTSTQGQPTGLYLNSISMISPDEGWAVGNTSP